jgi:hypothetical protein
VLSHSGEAIRQAGGEVVAEGSRAMGPYLFFRDPDGYLVELFVDRDWRALQLPVSDARLNAGRRPRSRPACQSDHRQAQAGKTVRLGYLSSNPPQTPKRPSTRFGRAFATSVRSRVRTWPSSIGMPRAGSRDCRSWHASSRAWGPLGPRQLAGNQARLPGVTKPGYPAP